QHALSHALQLGTGIGDKLPEEVEPEVSLPKQAPSTGLAPRGRKVRRRFWAGGTRRLTGGARPGNKPPHYVRPRPAAHSSNSANASSLSMGPRSMRSSMR